MSNESEIKRYLDHIASWNWAAIKNRTDPMGAKAIRMTIEICAAYQDTRVLDMFKNIIAENPDSGLAWYCIAKTLFDFRKMNESLNFALVRAHKLGCDYIRVSGNALLYDHTVGMENTCTIRLETGNQESIINRFMRLSDEDAKKWWDRNNTSLLDG